MGGRHDPREVQGPHEPCPLVAYLGRLGSGLCDLVRSVVEAMTPRLSHILIGAGLVLGLWAAAVFGIDAYQKYKGRGNEVAAHIAEGEANAHQSQANASDAKISDLQAKVDSQAKDLGRLNAERDALLKRLAAKPVSHADPVGPNLSPTDALDALEAAVAERDEVIAKDAEVITSQAGIIKDQTVVIGQLMISRDEWKATAEARERQAIAQEAATKAWKDAVRSSKWSGRVQGFAAGVALGFLGGKR